MEKNNNTTLGFVTEIGTFGSMPINDPTVQPVEERKKLENLMETTDNPDLKAYLQTQLSKK